MFKSSCLVFIIGIFFICDYSFGQTHFARQDGDWHDVDTWSTVATGGASCSCLPGVASDVLIDGYDITVSAATGNVTVADIKMTNARGAHTDVVIEGGVTVAVINNFEIECDNGSRDALLTVEGNNTILQIAGNFLADQNDGDDLIVDIDDNAAIRIAGTSSFLQDGGDDMRLRLNRNSGNSAEFYSEGPILFDHDDGDDIEILVDDVNSELLCDDNFTINLNDGNDDEFDFDIDNGDVDILGNFILNRSNGTAEIRIDMDGGNVFAEDIIITSSGPLESDGAVFILIDNDAYVECTNFSSTFSGADELHIHINEGAGDGAELVVNENMTITRSSGDDIEIFVFEDNSSLSVGEDLTINLTGADSEEFAFIVDNDASVSIDGNCTIIILDGKDVATHPHVLQLTGAGSNPSFSVGGDFTWTSSINLVDVDLDLDGGVFSVGGDMTLIQNDGANDFDVEIDGDAILNVAQDFEMLLNGGNDMSLSIGLNGVSTAQVNVDGNVTLNHDNSTAASTFEHFIYNDTRFNILGDMNLICGQNTSDKFVQDIRNTAEVSVSGNVEFETSFANRIEISMLDNTFFRIGGNFIRGTTPNQFGILNCNGGGDPTVEYMGSIAQIIAEDMGNGGDYFYYHNLEIDNSFATNPQLTMQGLATAHASLILNDGVVASDATDILVVDDNATAIGASNASHVDGYMRKVGNDDFIFPSGDEGIYAPISITGITAITEQFEAQYIYVRPDDDGYDETAIPASLDHISYVEYWLLNRTSGASNPTVTLSWDSPRSGGIVMPSSLRVARWDGVAWNNEGAANLTGGAASGTIDNSVPLTSFSNTPYTIASTVFANVLPVEFISFTANLVNEEVILNWETASEINNNYFLVEVSVNGLNWVTIDKVQGSGNSSSNNRYISTDHNPNIGYNYYRLKQVDYDGQFTYSNVEIVEYSKGQSFLIYPNPASNIISIKFEDYKPEFIQLMNLNGQNIELPFTEIQGAITSNISALPAGIYLLNIDGVINKLIVQH